MTSPAAATDRLPPHRILLLASIVLLAMNLRSPIVAVAPVLDRIVADIGLTAVTAGLLTTLPVLAFAATTPIAAALLGRIGPDLAVALSLLGVIVGVAIRSVGGGTALFVGTIVMGFAITLGNVLAPVLIRRSYPPGRRAGVTGLYTAALNVGSMLTLVGTVPISDAIGWRLGLDAWSVLAVLALGVWIAAVGWRRVSRAERIAPGGAPARATSTASSAPQHTATGSEAADTIPAEAMTETAPQRVVRTPVRGRSPMGLFWVLGIAFGGQAFSYYGLTAWLPQILAAVSDIPTAGSSAGSSLFQVFAIVGALGVPVLTARLPYRWILVMLVVLWAIVPLGLLMAPSLWVLWLCAGGIAQGGTFTLVFIVVVELARTDSEAGRGSALVQGIGYTIGATGPSVFGALHEMGDGWTGPLVALLAAVTALLVGGLVVTRRLGSKV
jgi:CP family cyanate transporter-like MFS transporter